MNEFRCEALTCMPFPVGQIPTDGSLWRPRLTRIHVRKNNQKIQLPQTSRNSRLCRKQVLFMASISLSHLINLHGPPTTLISCFGLQTVCIQRMHTGCLHKGNTVKQISFVALPQRVSVRQKANLLSISGVQFCIKRAAAQGY